LSAPTSIFRFCLFATAMTSSFVERRREPIGNTFLNGYGETESEIRAGLGLETAHGTTRRSASCPALLEAWQSVVRTPCRVCPSMEFEEASTAEGRTSNSSSGKEDAPCGTSASPQTPRCSQMLAPGTAAKPSTTTMASVVETGRRRRRRGATAHGHDVQSSAPIGADGGSSSGTSVLGASMVASCAARCIADSSRHSEANPTTWIIRNLPVGVMQVDFQRAVDESGFAGQWDFLHVPVGLDSGLSKGCAFVNFRTAEVAARFRSRWHDKQTCLGFPHVSPAVVQGRAANIANWNTPKNQRIRNPRFKPVILPEGRPTQSSMLTTVIPSSEERDGGSRWLGGGAFPEPHATPSTWPGATTTASSPSFTYGVRRNPRPAGSVHRGHPRLPGSVC